MEYLLVFNMSSMPVVLDAYKQNNAIRNPKKVTLFPKWSIDIAIQSQASS